MCTMVHKCQNNGMFRPRRVRLIHDSSMRNSVYRWKFCRCDLLRRGTSRSKIAIVQWRYPIRVKIGISLNDDSLANAQKYKLYSASDDESTAA